LKGYLKTHALRVSPELGAHFNAMGHTWEETFGEAADEVFMAWEYGLFVNQVTKAGKAEYSLPMYMNAQLPVEFEQAGDYPTAGRILTSRRCIELLLRRSTSIRRTSTGRTLATG
jgi:hypothetical protein